MKRSISLLLIAVLVLSIPLMATPASAAAYTGLMRQYESKWANIYHNGGSLYNCGCGLFSLVNAVGYLTGYQMDVVELADWAHANGMYNVTGADGTYRTSFYPAASKRYGGTYGFTIDCGSGSGYWSTASDARLKNHLIAGGTAIVHVSNHFICLVGYDTSTGKYHLYESAPDPYRGTNYNGGDVWFTEAQLCSGYTDVDWFCLISATSGWKQNSKGWWYEYPDGSYATGWAEIGSNWYYFDKDGYMQTGWLYEEDTDAWYYLEPEKGYMRTGWVRVGNYYYYMNSSGKMLTGWQEVNGEWSYLNTSDDMPKGAMYTGWKEIDGYWYYFNKETDGTSGVMRTGWLQLGDKWYFLESSGKMLTGWRFIQGKWYHLDEESGVMSTSAWVRDEDAWYYVDASGVMTDGAEWHGVFEDGLDIGTDFYATIDIPKTGTRVGVDSDSNNVEVQAVRAEDASDYNEQLWYFERRADDGSYRITNVATGLCMDQVEGHIDAGTNVRVYSGNDAMAQRWFVFANGDTHGLVSACSAWNMTVLDVMDNLGTEGTNIRIWSKNTSTAQQFAITPVVCQHNWSDGYCPDCGEYCQHSYENGICSVCGMNCAHSYEASVTPPTYTTGGKTTYTCTACGTSYTDQITNATGHSYSGGKCTICGAADPNYSVITKPTITLSYPTLSFEDQIQYNVYFTLSDKTNVAEMGLITFSSKLTSGTITDAMDVISGYTTSGSSYIAHTNGIPAKNLGDALYFKVYAKLTDGSYIYTDIAGYNAVAYAKTILGSSTTSMDAKRLMVAMLNYGAAAQVAFNYNTDNLMNGFLKEAAQNLIQPYNESMVDDVVAADSAKAGHFVMQSGSFTGIFPTVSFEGAFSVNYYFTPGKTVDSSLTFVYWDADTYNSVDKLTTANATGMLPMTKEGDQWTAAVEGIAAKDMDKTIYVVAIYKSGGTAYTSKVIPYSIGKYCEGIAANGNSFGAATAVYGYYAKTYFANL